jgi:hypothetical protein
MIRALIGLCLLVLSASAGCATHPHATLGTAIDATGRRAELLTVPPALRAAGRLPAIAVHVTIPGAEAQDDALAFDAAVLGDEVVALLRASRVFESVFPVSGLRAEAEGGRPYVLAAADEARALGASLLVEASVEAPVLRRTERAFVIPTLVWATGFPSHWFHNHTYRLDLRIRLRLRDLNTGEVLPERPLEPAFAEDDLNFFERTSSVLTYLLGIPLATPFCPVDEDKVARALAPAALARPVSQFLGRLAESLEGEVYSFELQHRQDGAPIHVRYPPAGKPIYLLKRTVRLSAVAEARPGETIREVRLGGRVVFPARSAVGTTSRRQVPLDGLASVAPGEALLVEVRDSSGRTSTCLLVARRRSEPPAARKVTGRKA